MRLPSRIFDPRLWGCCHADGAAIKWFLQQAPAAVVQPSHNNIYLIMFTQ